MSAVGDMMETEANSGVLDEEEKTKTMGGGECCRKGGE